MSDESLSEIQRALADLQSHKRGILEQIREQQRRTVDIARTAWRAQEEERGRLARELHDGLGQNLTALKNELARMVDAGQAGPDRLAAALELCGACLEETRTMARALRPAVLDDLGLASAIRQLCRTLELEQVATEFIPSGPVDELSRDLGTLVYRLLQEATTNVMKHARASVAIIRLVVDAEQVVLVVMDDGVGFDADDAETIAAGFGVRAMRERVALFGGELAIESEPAEGTRVRATIPRRNRSRP